MNTNETKAHYVYQDTLENLKNVNNKESYSTINTIRTNLISSLYAMSMAKYKNFN